MVSNTKYLNKIPEADNEPRAGGASARRKIFVRC